VEVSNVGPSLDTLWWWHSAEVIRARAEEIFPEVLKAATRWQPSGKQ
jgi:hypothetical protein